MHGRRPRKLESNSSVREGAAGRAGGDGGCDAERGVIALSQSAFVSFRLLNSARSKPSITS